jgi:hypothetical protein
VGAIIPLSEQELAEIRLAPSATGGGHVLEGHVFALLTNGSDVHCSFAWRCVHVNNEKCGMRLYSDPETPLDVAWKRAGLGHTHPVDPRSLAFYEKMAEEKAQADAGGEEGGTGTVACPRKRCLGPVLRQHVRKGHGWPRLPRGTLQHHKIFWGNS